MSFGRTKNGGRGKPRPYIVELTFFNHVGTAVLGGPSLLPLGAFFHLNGISFYSNVGEGLAPPGP